jgi:hypothetical protein
MPTKFRKFYLKKLLDTKKSEAEAVKKSEPKKQSIRKR